MIDTIVLRIHDTHKHRRLIKTLDNQNYNKGYSTEAAKVDGKALAKLRDQGITDTWEQLDILKLYGQAESMSEPKSTST